MLGVKHGSFLRRYPPRLPFRSTPLPPVLRVLRYNKHERSADGARNHLLTKHRGIAQRLLVEQQNHCAALASACCTKFQSVLAWLQRKPKDIEEVGTHVRQGAAK